MRLINTVTCPYCGFKNDFTTEVARGREILICNDDYGGCGGSFVVKYAAHLTTEVKQVEGEEIYAIEKSATRLEAI